jgi:hypothetical protein
MLIVPYLAGLLVAGFGWPDAPLLGAWIAGYLLSYYVFVAVKSRRFRRYREQVGLYAALALPMAAVTVVARPAVLWYGPAFAGLFAVNLAYAWRRNDRAVLNDVASVVQSCLMVFVVATVGGASACRAPLSSCVGLGRAAPAAGLCLAYFLGTVLYVKTMIRERSNPAYRRWSVGYHAAALGGAAVVSPWTAVLFGWLFARATLFPGRTLRPARIGVVEIANCVALVAALAVTWG